MRRTILIIVVICILLVGCTTKTNDNTTQTPSSTINVKAKPTAILTPKPTEAPTPKPTPTPITEVISYKPLPDIDTSYVDETIRPSYLIFDDVYMYYIDGKAIKKRHVETGEENLIFDGVYDNCYLCLQDGWLYLYTKGKGIIKVKTDGTKMEVVRNVQAERVMISGDCLYYYAVTDPLYDYPYSLYQLNLKTNANKMIHINGTDAIYVNKEIYYCSYDGMQDDLWIFDTKTKEHESSGVQCNHVPIIIDNKAYYFFEDWDSGDDNALYINDLKTGKQKKINIDGSGLVQYYNYLLYKDDKNNLNAFNIKSEKSFNIMPLKDKWIEAVSNDKLYIGSNDQNENLELYMMSMDYEITFEKICSIELNYKYELPKHPNSKITDLKKNKKWTEIKYATDLNKFGSGAFEPVVYKCKKYYSAYEDNKGCIYVDNGEKKKKIIDNSCIVENFPSFIIINDTVYYCSNNDPGYLYSYDLATQKIKKFNTGMGYPIEYIPYYQYLIIKSYYKEFSYSFLDNENLDEDELNPIYTIAFNMETGQMAQIEYENLD